MNLADHEPLVVMGRGHSGTRVLTWICHRLGMSMGVHESRPSADVHDRTFSRKIIDIARATMVRPVPDRRMQRSLRRFERAVNRYHIGLGAPSCNWGWKFPETYLITPLVAKTFPRARYIHLVRDGRDIAFKNHLTDDPHRKLGHTLLAHVGMLGKSHHMQAARSWAFQVDRFDEDKKALPADRILEMTFEELCSNTLDQTHRICDFLGIPMTADAEEYAEKMINPAKLSQYREQDSRQVREAEEAATATLERYGYVEAPFESNSTPS